MNRLLAFQAFVAEQYKSKLDLPLLELAREKIPRVSSPKWQWQTSDLVPASAADASGALILDEEIGLCLFAQSFGAKTDIRAQLANALQLRAALRPRRQTLADDIDHLGEWSVAMLWLMEVPDFERWILEVADLRQQTSHFEEVSVDLLVNRQKEWNQSCRAHGVPRLLFNVRAALRRKKLDDTLDWMGAEAVIADKLKRIPAGLPASLARYSSELSAAVEKVIGGLSAGRGQISSPIELNSVSIRNFRNINSLTLDLRDSGESVGVNVIQGPNGTGKSSISEAIAIASSSVSSRYLDFLNDSNEGTASKATKYIERYLSPLEASEGLPSVGLNREPQSISLADAETAVARHATLSGTILSQSSGDNLLRIRASELGTQIAGNYSRGVGEVIDFVERRQTEAEGERTAFNRQWGLRANVSRDDTARVRIAGSVLASMMPVPRSTLNSIEAAADIDWRFKQAFQGCLQRWQEWESEATERERAISKAISEEELRETLRAQIDRYDAISKLATEVVQSVLDVRASAREVTPSLATNVRVWCRWLDIEERGVVDTRVVTIRRESDGLQRRLSELAKAGRSVAERLKQLENIHQFLDEHWAKDHPNTCPICASDVTERNGILSTVAGVKSNVESELQATRDQYAEAKRRSDDTLSRLRELDSKVPPLEGDALSHTRQALDLVFGAQNAFDRLRETEFRSTVFAALEFMERASLAAPPRRSDDDTTRLIERNSRQLWDTFRKFAEVSEAPEAWKSVLNKIYSELTITIRDHLPKTIQALWWEIARNIMPAPWQYPGEIEFEVEHRRSQAEARVVVRGSKYSPLAAHILNGAELHNLGLAWFVTRYLTFGRFSYSFIVLDDPAYSMDQPTFRDFCRILAVLVRLHSAQKIPLTLVLFLHQDDRAMDAARFTNGTLHLLRWHSGAAHIEDKYRMRLGSMQPVTPYSVLRAG